MISGVQQGYPISPFLLNFFIDEVMEDALGGLQDVGVEMANGEKLFDSDGTEYLACPLESMGNLKS